MTKIKNKVENKNGEAGTEELHNKESEAKQSEKNDVKKKKKDKKKSKDKGKKKGGKKKSDKKAAEKKIEELDKELAIEKDKRLRNLAEFDNFRRRSRSDLKLLTQNATERVLLQMLPVLDDCERMNLQDIEKMELDTLLKGTRLIYRKLQDRLGSLDLTPIKSEGEPFDVNLHEAISEIESDDVEPGTIITEVEKGYKLKDKVIRHAKVIVSKAVEKDSVETDRSDKSEDDKDE